MLHLLATEPPSVGRHNGDVACRQAREPREKNIGVNIVIGILPVIILIYIVIGSSSTHRYNYLLPLYFLAN